MTYQWLSSKWPAGKARRGSMSFGPSRTGVPCDRDATQAPGHFELNPSGRSFLGEFAEKIWLGQPRTLSGQGFTRFLKFAQAPRGNWQAIPVTQH